MFTASYEKKVITFEGKPTAKILVVVGSPHWDAVPVSHISKSMILDVASRYRVLPECIAFTSVLDFIPPGRKPEALDPLELEAHIQSFKERIKNYSHEISVPLDNLALEAVADKDKIDKWQCSIFRALDGSKCIPLFHPERVFSDMHQSPFFYHGWHRIADELKIGREIVTIERKFHTSPKFSEAMDFLSRCQDSEYLSVDIENFIAGQIRCVAFAPSSLEAMSIPTLPSQWEVTEFHALWKKIKEVLEGNSKKVFQNFIHDCSYFSKYGIAVKNLYHDTMLCQKWLFPELEMGLATIARLYTKEPYWKDEGKDEQDIEKYYLYNCKDAALTLEAMHGQVTDLEARGLKDTFYNFLMALTPIASEMCWSGLPIDLNKRNEIKSGLEKEIEDLGKALNEEVKPWMPEGINPRSPLQVKNLFKAKKYKLPIQKGKESTDYKALLKLQMKYPQDKTFGMLMELSSKNKSLSSYFKPEPYPDGRMRFSFNIHGTETGRWSCRKDSWDQGINAQTCTSDFKKCVVAPVGWTFLECDLKQADARFVAWDAAAPTLMKFFNENIDIHRFVAARPELFNKPLDQITSEERQLGKKVGHAANYGMMAPTLVEQCLVEMNLVLSISKAEQMLQGYHNFEPAIRMWQNRIIAEIRRNKKLTTPLGRERYFYGRLEQETFKEGFAYRPQSTVADIIGKLLLFVAKHRNPENLRFALQIHDSALMLVKDTYLDEALALIKAEDDWNPKMHLLGGVLQIPIEAKAGNIWGEAKKIYG